MRWILVSYCVITVAIADILTKLDTKSTPLGMQSNGWLDGWTRVVHINFSQSGTDCPKPWVLRQEGLKTYCAIESSESGCSPISVHTLDITKIRGLVTGYQKGTPDGFRASKENNADIDDPYVDGVSITLGHGKSHRKHVWTYAAGLTMNGNYPSNNCPCSVTPGPKPSSFVGEHYYCSSGSPDFPASGHIYVDNPLWDGNGCTNNRDNCCSNAGLPWFYREFPTKQEGYIEIRICRNQDASDEDILINGLEIYVQYN